ncbi:MAG: HIT family protein [Alphaproteobacteria bacterium]|nr:HIT family protein [Alphaproteobacteria bacterium]
MTFELHPQLASDTLPVTDWPLCRVLLMNDATYPWLILVPRRPDMRDLHDLALSDQLTLIQELSRASKGLQALTNCNKTNVAALGNQTPQLHVHVIARFQTDPAWPGPVWGVSPPTPYDPAGAEALITRLTQTLGSGLG